MVSFSNILPGWAPFHLLAFSTLLGTELYQSFVMTKVCHRALPRPAFTTLQKRVFPIYFQAQSLLLALTAVTLPPHGPLSLIKEKIDWIPFVIAGSTALLNLIVYGPRTKKIMIQRVHQETKDKMYPTGDAGEPSPDMKQLNRAFSRAHAMSIHLNLITIGATLFYGWRLATRLNVN